MNSRIPIFGIGPPLDEDYPDYEPVTDANKVEGSEVELEDTCANDTAVVCRNGGICLSTIAGPKCHCPLQGGGKRTNRHDSGV